MHETVAASRILETALSRLGARPGRIARLVVRLGALDGMSPEALRSAFDLVASGTAADGADLAVHIEPVRLVCGRCGASESSPSERIPSTPIPCPRCGDPYRVTANRGWSLESIGVVS